MLFAYLFFNAGISYSMHFCGDKLTSSRMFAAKKGCICSSDEKPAPFDCCKDVEVESGKDDQQVATLYKINLEKVLLTEINFIFIEWKKLYEESFAKNLMGEHSPPPYKVPIFIFNQIFRL